MSRKKTPNRKSAGHEAPYEVGYGKPPRHTRFKPGQSGNPKGRPSGQPNFKTTLNEVFNERVVLRMGGQTRSVPASKAILLRIRNDALQGVPKMIAAYLQLFRGESREELQGEVQGLPEIDHQGIIAEYFGRQCTKRDEGAAAESDGSPEPGDPQNNSSSGSENE